MREKSLHNDVLARFTISSVNHRSRKCRSVRLESRKPEQQATYLKGIIAQTIHPYPTQAEAIRKIGDAYFRSRLTPRVTGCSTADGVDAIAA
jgi:hypothetical protein